jgi:crotonobetainyl-CoA:carnitine CoA-transferase CaiB-like acyl-CoA transferase
VLLSPWGPLANQHAAAMPTPLRQGSDLSAFFGASMLSDVLGAGSKLSCACPLFWGNMITSIHIKTAIDMALFHLQRVGEGQRVDLNLMRSGMYSNLMYINMSQVNSEMSLEIEKMSFESYCTKDGKWVQLLGVDYLKHVPRLFECFDIKGKAWWRVFAEVLTTPSVLATPLKIVPLVFANITRSLRAEINRRNWADLKTLFDEKGMWYTHIAVPSQVFHDAQAQVTRTFLYPTEKDVDVNYTTGRIQNPCQFTTWKQGEIVYGNPDSTQVVGLTTSKGEWSLKEFKESML